MNDRDQWHTIMLMNSMIDTESRLEDKHQISMSELAYARGSDETTMRPIACNKVFWPSPFDAVSYASHSFINWFLCGATLLIVPQLNRTQPCVPYIVRIQPQPTLKGSTISRAFYGFIFKRHIQPHIIVGTQFVFL